MNLFSNDSFLGRFLDRVSSFVLLNLYFISVFHDLRSAGYYRRSIFHCSLLFSFKAS